MLKAMRVVAQLAVIMGAWAWFASACSEGDRYAQVIVYVAADDPVVAQTAAVRFIVHETGDEVWLCSKPPLRPQCRAGEAAPTGPDGTIGRLPLLSQDLQANPNFTVSVALFETAQSVPFLEQTVRGAFDQGEVSEVRVRFQTSCRDRQACPEGFRCQHGVCIEHCVATAPHLEGPREAVIASCGDPCSGPICGRPCDGPTCATAGVRRDLGYLCREDGVLELDDRSDCLLGCDQNTGACGHARASNGVSPKHSRAEMADLVLSPAALVDGRCEAPARYTFSDTGSIYGPAGLLRPAGEGRLALVGTPAIGPGIRFSTDNPRGHLVWEMRSLDVPQCAEVFFEGMPAPPIWLVHEDVTVNGSIYIAPGRAGAMPVGALGMGSASTGTSGGVGASFGTLGGLGGQGEGGGAPGTVAMRYGEGLVPLIAGSPGGAATGNTRGGRAGGALQITAERIVIAGSVSADGGGGQAAAAPLAAGGGGSGGAILLEAAVVELEPEGSRCSGRRGSPGAINPCIATPGGAGGASSDGLTAEGSRDVSVAAENGAPGAYGGGGGGGLGRVVIRLLAECANPSCDEELGPTRARYQTLVRSVLEVLPLEPPFPAWSVP